MDKECFRITVMNTMLWWGCPEDDIDDAVNVFIDNNGHQPRYTLYEYRMRCLAAIQEAIKKDKDDSWRRIVVVSGGKNE